MKKGIWINYEKIIFILILLLRFNCSPKFEVIKIKVNDINEIFIEDEKVTISEFAKEFKLLTKGMSNKNLRNLKFSIQASKDTTVKTLVEIRDEIRALKNNLF